MKNFHVRRRAHWVVTPLFLAVAGCGGDSGTNNGGSGGSGGGGGGGGGRGTSMVTVGNDFFDPVSIQVSPGTTVTWTWAGGSPEGHNVKFANSTVSAPSMTKSTGTF